MAAAPAPAPAGWRRWRALWRDTFAVYGAADRDSAEMRGRHLRAVSRLTPLMVLANLFNGSGLLLAFAGQRPAAELGLWGGLMALFSTAALRSWWRHRAPAPRRASVRAVRRFTQGALALGLLWAWPPAAWLAQADESGRLLLGWVLLGMMSGGAVAMAAVPAAALGYIGVLGLAGSVALWTSGLALAPLMQALLLMYLLVLAGCVLGTAWLFTARLKSEREAARQGQLVGLLLRDFEEHAADLLWEVGPTGLLTHVSPRLAAALQVDAARLQTLTLPQALALRAPRLVPPEGGAASAAPPSAPLDAPALGHHDQALRTALAQGRAFRDLELPLVTAEGPRWWSLTAKPLLDEAGHQVGWRGVIADVTAAREAHHRLAMLAHYDSLTGLANRVQLRERLAEALEGVRAAGPGVPAGADGVGGAAAGAAAATAPLRRCALVCLDVDHFKTINDTLGHGAGDAVLVTIAQRLQGCLRWPDLAARLGGDEFALLVDNIGSDEELHALARRLVGTLNQPTSVDGQQVPLGVSLGLALAPDHGQTLDALMSHADLALYAAKEAGKGRYEVYAPRLGDRHRRRVAIEQGLRGAVAAGQLQLHWQPRVAIDGWQVHGAEALLRWRHPELGLVSPVEFVGVAEETGLIDAIGAWVLQQACREAVALPPALVVSVNVSPAQLRRPDFVRTVQWALDEAGLAPERLELEITESLFIGDTAPALAQLHALREAGIRVALDDFGTGYSSLAYLRRFPFDTLKIDRAFVRELLIREDARAIVQTIVNLAEALGMHTVAEGVEEPAQLAVLQQVGCHAIQGWLVARAMPAEAFSRLLANWVSQAPRPGPASQADAPAARAPARVAAGQG